jgi:hypothetical protein
VLSLAALAFRLAFVLAGPPIGMIADRAGMETALVVLAVGLTVLAGGALIAFRRGPGGGAGAGPVTEVRLTAGPRP